MNINGKPDDLLEQIKNLSITYNSKVTPRRKIEIQKSEDPLEMLMKNRIRDSNIASSDRKTAPTVAPTEMEEEKKPESKTDKPSRPSKYKHLTMDEKRELVALSLSPNQNPEKVGKLKGIAPTNIMRWTKELSANPSAFGKDLRKEKNGRKPKFPELEDHIKDWFTKLRNAKIAVSSVMVREEAQKYINAKQLQGLNLSKGWLWKLLKRLNIVKRKGTKISQKSAALLEFNHKKFLKKICF